MSLTKFTENTNVISELPDTPSLTAQELKAKFDEVGNKVKEYLNNTLTTETDQLVATEKSSLQQSISNLSTQTTQNINNLRNEIHGEMTYSTDEVNTGKTWIDGKPIYRKVVTKTTTSDSDTINITDIPFDYLKMDARVILAPGQVNEYRVEPYYASNSDYVRVPFVKPSEKKIAINSKSLAGTITRKWIVILEYTKTTDTTN